MGETRPARAVFAREIGELVELLGVDVSQWELGGDGVVAALFLGLDVGVEPAVEFGIRAGGLEVPVESRGVDLLIVDEEKSGGVE